MPRRTTQLPLETAEQVERHTRVEGHIKRLLEKFRELRSTRGRGRFGDLDRALGRASGYVSDVFAGNERLGLERFFAGLDYLETSPSEFFHKGFNPPKIPGSPEGWLLDLEEPRPGPNSVSGGARLARWARGVRVLENGSSFIGDPEELRNHANRDFEGAVQWAVANLEAFFLSEPTGVDPGTAPDLTRWLTILAHLVRVRDDRNLASELFDAAFRIEEQIGDIAIRSFIYRLAAYLLSDFGRLAEAEEFAIRAVRLATLCGKRRLLGQALYVEGLMTSYQGRSEEAMILFEASLRHLEGDESETRASAWHHLALIHLDQGQPDRAEAILTDLEIMLGTTVGPNYAKLLAARGEVAKLKGRDREAVEHFDEAIEIFEAIGNPAEIALIGLQKLRCLLDAGRFGDARATANRMLALAQAIRGNRVGESILLEVGRLSSRGELTVARVSEAIRVWRCPAGPSSELWRSS